MLLVVFAACPQLVARDAADDVPVVRVDALHDHLAAPARTAKPEYALRPARGFLIDATGFVFSPARMPRGVSSPNTISILRPSRGTYTVPWFQGKTKYLVTQDTAVPEDNSFPPFTPISVGETLTIYIGHQSPHPKLGVPDLSVFWSTLATVKAPR